MKRVREYLDRHFCPVGSSTMMEKKNGHCSVFGSWKYPRDWEPVSMEEWNSMSEVKMSTKDHICVNINNETIIVGNTCVDDQWSKYQYLQTYEHIPRGEPDENGYYRRSTEDEVIRYIDGYYQKILRRREKLLKIKSKIDAQ
jgi:hypothetical protein